MIREKKSRMSIKRNSGRASFGVERYHELMSNIEFIGTKENFKTIMITSSEPGEGKTTVAQNLATTFAEHGKKTLLIDCDLRRTTLSKRYKHNRKEGLRAYFLDELSLKEAVTELVEPSNLSILSTFVPFNSPNQILSSEKMDQLLVEAKKVFERIIIDTPPLDFVADGNFLANKVDMSLLVVRSARTSLEQVKRSSKTLEKSSSYFAGAVLNFVKVKGDGKYY